MDFENKFVLKNYLIHDNFSLLFIIINIISNIKIDFQYIKFF